MYGGVTYDSEVTVSDTLFIHTFDDAVNFIILVCVVDFEIDVYIF